MLHNHEMILDEKIYNIKSLRLEKSSPQKEADHIKNHAPRS